MKALTLTQPWATLVAREAKRWETRSWRTNHRGPLAIHAAKGYPLGAMLLREECPFHAELRDAGPLPLGAFVCVVDLLDCIGTTEALDRYEIAGTREEAFGNWSPGRWAWRFGIIRTFEHPVPWRGMQGLWDVPDEFLPVAL